MTICWTIAGSDSGGGAGVQADLKTFQSLGVHGCTLLTAITAQNSRQVLDVAQVSPAMIRAQFKALNDDLPPVAVKTGMLGSSTTLHIVAETLAGMDCRLVVDPVMVATSGGVLMETSARKTLVDELLPRADLVTPNLIEAEALAGFPVYSARDMMAAAEQILKFGPKSVLVKGGHGGGRTCGDYWTDGRHSLWLHGPRIDTKNTHGTGCTLSAAITACLGLGYDMEDALVIARAFITQGLRLAKQVGGGPGPVHQGSWPTQQEDIPWMTDTSEAGQNRLEFPGTGPRPLGFYPIVDRASWLERLLPLGVTTAQLRVKDLAGSALREEIQRAVTIAKQYDCRLFINDFWEEALECDAYGVHLGQEDCATADLARLAEAGIRLGISTHSYGELARALACKPSYLALGPIYETTAKPMKFGPQGLTVLRRWQETLEMPVVAIGGISLDRASEVLATGVTSIAVISAVTQAPDPEKATQQWLKLFSPS